MTKHRFSVYAKTGQTSPCECAGGVNSQQSTPDLLGNDAIAPLLPPGVNTDDDELQTNIRKWEESNHLMPGDVRQLLTMKAKKADETKKVKNSLSADKGPLPLLPPGVK